MELVNVENGKTVTVWQSTIHVANSNIIFHRIELSGNSCCCCTFLFLWFFNVFFLSLSLPVSVYCLFIFIVLAPIIKLECTHRFRWNWLYLSIEFHRILMAYKKNQWNFKWIHKCMYTQSNRIYIRYDVNRLMCVFKPGEWLRSISR